MRGIQGEKLAALLESMKLPNKDKPRVIDALSVYDKWAEEINNIRAKTLNVLIMRLIDALNRYKFYIDVNLIFDSPEDFLYRQKGQLKIDNTVMEEFLPLFVKRCINFEFGKCELDICPQTEIFSSIRFASTLNNASIAGGIAIKTKAHDFSISRKLYIQSSYTPDFKPEETLTLSTNLGYILAEIKTNLDKTMFQEASATAHEVKQSVPGAKYYLLCDYLDMIPISTATTDIDEILITRKAKRISAGIRKNYATYSGRQDNREEYISFLKKNPYSPEIFRRFAEHIFSQAGSEIISEDDVLQSGYF